VEDDFNSFARTRAGRGIRKIALDELHCLEAREVVPLAGDETVDSANGFAAGEQSRGDGAPDKAASSSYQVFRQVTFSEWCQSPARYAAVQVYPGGSGIPRQSLIPWSVPVCASRARHALDEGVIQSCFRTLKRTTVMADV